MFNFWKRNFAVAMILWISVQDLIYSLISNVETSWYAYLCFIFECLTFRCVCLQGDIYEVNANLVMQIYWCKSSNANLTHIRLFCSKSCLCLSTQCCIIKTLEESVYILATFPRHLNIPVSSSHLLTHNVLIMYRDWYFLHVLFI